MFLSDELVEIGRKANKRNNLSMNEKLQIMMSICAERVRKAQSYEKALITRNVQSSYNLATKTLQKEGYPFFTPEKFKL